MEVIYGEPGYGIGLLNVGRISRSDFAYLVIYYATGSTIQALSAIVILISMWLGVLWVNRLPRDDRLWWKRFVGISLILLAALVAISYYPASALTITGEPSGDQIHWEISDGEPPYTVYVNGVETFQVIRER